MGKRKTVYDHEFKKKNGEDADPSSADFDPELVMVSGQGRKHGRTALGASSISVNTESLASIRARQTSSSPQIHMRDQPRLALVEELKSTKEAVAAHDQRAAAAEAQLASQSAQLASQSVEIQFMRTMLMNLYTAQGIVPPEMPNLGAMMINSPNTPFTSGAASNNIGSSQTGPGSAPPP